MIYLKELDHSIFRHFGHITNYVKIKVNFIVVVDLVVLQVELYLDLVVLSSVVGCASFGISCSSGRSCSFGR